VWLEQACSYLNLAAGRRHNRRTRDWRVGRLIAVLRDKARQAGIILILLDERELRRPARRAGPGFPNPAAGCSAARAAGWSATAT
jgi:hypothetical protein